MNSEAMKLLVELATEIESSIAVAARRSTSQGIVVAKLLAVELEESGYKIDFKKVGASRVECYISTTVDDLTAGGPSDVAGNVAYAKSDNEEEALLHAVLGNLRESGGPA